MSLHDVVVVGAGPAGSTLAYRLAKAGLDVALVEKAKFPRNKVCGGGLDATFFKYLPEGMVVEDVVEDEIRELVVRVGNRVGIHPVEGKLVMSSRDRLDATLAFQAIEAGAELIHGEAERVDMADRDSYCRVRIDGDTVRGKVLVGADGAYSLVARTFDLGRPRVVYVGTDWQVKVPQSVLDQYRGKMHLELLPLPKIGFSWIFPKADHLSVGVGTAYCYAKHLETMTTSLMLEKSLLGYPVKKGGWWIPFAKPGARFVRDRVLVVGDAAGMVDPGSGGGIGWAVRSSQMAANVLLAYFGGRTAPADWLHPEVYQEMIDTSLMKEFKASEILRNNILLAQALGRGATTGWWRESLRAVAGGDSYVDIMMQHRVGYSLGRLLQGAVSLLIDRRSRR
ncbi:MAG: geranylgeranyl reductase family protein [Chloroflexota bacterium]